MCRFVFVSPANAQHSEAFLLFGLACNPLKPAYSALSCGRATECVRKRGFTTRGEGISQLMLEISVLVSMIFLS